ncbi:MAG: hypothetical protein HRU13_01870 [Phycisphaerales bacterium]|nr:hypothetical protein [Phycisphaerales bacterium]
MPSSTKRAKRVLLSSEEEAIFDELLGELSSRAGVRLGFSHVTRAMWEMMLEAEHTFQRVSAPSLTRPATQDADATAEFESEIKAWLIDVIQSMPRRQR